MASTFSSISFFNLKPLRFRSSYLCSASPLKLLNMTISAPSTPHSTSTELHEKIDIKAHVLKSLPKTPPLVVTETIQQLVKTAPTTIAPAICLATCELVGGTKEVAMDVAGAMQLMHVASYAHDQLPALKSSRRNSTSNDAFMLLSHMSIYSFAYEMIGNSTSFKPEHGVKVMVEIAEVMGASGVLDGQYIEANAGEGHDLYEVICEKREGKVASCAAACGAIVGGCTDEEVKKLRKFGLYVGMMHGLLGLEGKYEAAQRFKTLAKLEIETMENLQEEKVKVVSKLIDLWYDAGEVAKVAVVGLE